MIHDNQAQEETASSSKATKAPGPQNAYPASSKDLSQGEEQDHSSTDGLGRLTHDDWDDVVLEPGECDCDGVVARSRVIPIPDIDDAELAA